MGPKTKDSMVIVLPGTGGTLFFVLPLLHKIEGEAVSGARQVVLL
jgi:superfamily II DNA/RNA helicase